MPNPDTTTYRMRGRVVVRRIGADSLLVPVSGAAAGGNVYPVNETALCVWNCISSGGTARQAARQLTASYRVTEPQALIDCRACIQAFLEESLIEAQTP